jgi:hypothetical protein
MFLGEIFAEHGYFSFLLVRCSWLMFCCHKSLFLFSQGAGSKGGIKTGSKMTNLQIRSGESVFRSEKQQLGKAQKESKLAIGDKSVFLQKFGSWRLMA